MNDMATVPYYVYEAATYRCEKLTKRLVIVSVLSAAALAATNVFWANRKATKVIEIKSNDD